MELPISKITIRVLMISKKTVTRRFRENGSTDLAKMTGFPLDIICKKMGAKLMFETT
jgi:hypothetical protein